MRPDPGIDGSPAGEVPVSAGVNPTSAGTGGGFGLRKRPGRKVTVSMINAASAPVLIARSRSIRIDFMQSQGRGAGNSPRDRLKPPFGSCRPGVGERRTVDPRYSPASILTDSNRQYELVLMLDPDLEESERENLAAGARSAIEEQGSLVHEDNWGLREMAYEINHKNQSDYRLFRFDGSSELLDRLDHSLKIADGVVRFRIFRVDPEDPILPAPPATAQVMAPTGDDDERRGRGGRYRDE